MSKQVRKKTGNLYVDKAGRVVYWNRYRQCGYVMNQHDEQLCGLWRIKLPLSLLLAYALYRLVNPLVGILAGLVAYIGSTVVFYKGFIDKRPEATRFAPPKKGGHLSELWNTASTGWAFSGCGLLVLFSFMMIYSVKKLNVSQQTAGVYWFVIILCGLLAVFMLVLGIHRYLDDKRKRS